MEPWEWQVSMGHQDERCSVGRRARTLEMMGVLEGGQR